MSSILAELMEALCSGSIKIIDLSKLLGPSTPVISLPVQYRDTPALRIETLSRYDTTGPQWYWNLLHIGEHTGTHFDAPIHWITGKDVPNNACDTIPVRYFVAPAVVIDSSKEVRCCSDYMLTTEAIISWERKHGCIKRGSWVLMRTDWSRRTSAEEFLNEDEFGAHSPGFHCETTKFLVEQRDILGIGVETVGIDPGQASKFDPPFPNHALVLGAGKFGLAGLTKLDELTPTGAVLFVAPLKIVEGSGSPVRVLALVSTQQERS